jgi:hypothetical protein
MPSIQDTDRFKSVSPSVKGGTTRIPAWPPTFAALMSLASATPYSPTHNHSHLHTSVPTVARSRPTRNSPGCTESAPTSSPSSWPAVRGCPAGRAWCLRGSWELMGNGVGSAGWLGQYDGMWMVTRGESTYFGNPLLTRNTQTPNPKHQQPTASFNPFPPPN